MKVAELERALLDYWVARALGYKSGNDVPSTLTGEWSDGSGFRNAWQPSNEWGQGGPIIERERIVTSYGYNWRADGDCWTAATDMEFFGTRGADCPNACGPTLLVAAMRCFVASKFGENVDAQP